MIKLERRRVWMVSVVGRRIVSVDGGRGIGGRLKTVPVGIEKRVPWRVVWGRI